MVLARLQATTACQNVPLFSRHKAPLALWAACRLALEGVGWMGCWWGGDERTTRFLSSGSPPLSRGWFMVTSGSSHGHMRSLRHIHCFWRKTSWGAAILQREMSAGGRRCFGGTRACPASSGRAFSAASPGGSPGRVPEVRAAGADRRSRESPRLVVNSRNVVEESAAGVLSRCAASRRSSAMRLFSLLFGWWGFPFGLVITPVQIGRNLVGMFRAHRSDKTESATGADGAGGYCQASGGDSGDGRTGTTSRCAVRDMKNPQTTAHGVCRILFLKGDFHDLSTPTFVDVACVRGSCVWGRERILRREERSQRGVEGGGVSAGGLGRAAGEIQ